MTDPEESAGSKVGRVALRTCLVAAAVLALIILVVGGLCFYVLQTS